MIVLSRCFYAKIRTRQISSDLKMAERVGFEPTYRGLAGNSISSRARYGRTSLPLREVF